MLSRSSTIRRESEILANEWSQVSSSNFSTDQLWCLDNDPAYLLQATEGRELNLSSDERLTRTIT